MNSMSAPRKRSSAKHFAAVVIRGISHLSPTALLFSIGLVIRRMRHGLEGNPKKQFLCRTLDFAILSFRPAKTTRVVKWEGRQARMWLRVNDPMHYDLALGIHEPLVRDFLAASLKPGMTVFDIGSNVGYFAIFSALLVGSQGRVIAIEGDPEVAALVRENAALNRLSNITVIAGVASRANGVLRFGRGKASGWSGLHSQSAEEWIEVPAHTVDSLAEQLGLQRMDFVKVDVEGAEEEVIAGMTESLRHLVPAVLVELHPGAESPLPLLAEANYQVRCIESGDGPAHYFAERIAENMGDQPAAKSPVKKT
jgi:FkbM family methyltransferase